MRIAMIHSTFAVRGGAEQYIHDLSVGLTARGHEVRVFSRDDGIPRRLAARLGDRLPVPLRKAFVHLGDLVDPTGLRPGDLREFAPDAVHVHNWQELGVLPLARLSRAYPTVHTVHDHAIVDPNNALGSLGRSRLLDAALAVRSAWIVRRFRRMLLLFAAERTREAVRRSAPRGRQPAGRIVPLAVPTAWHRLAWPPGRRDVFLFLGALSEHKGLDLLLDAWRVTRPGTLLIAGDGPLRARVEREAADSPTVRYLGFLDEEGKRAAFTEAGWLVFPSRLAETYGLGCAEALMAGRPILAGARVRPPMAADASVLLFRGRDELSHLLQNAAVMLPDRYAAMAASAAADGRKLDWDDHVSAVIDAYESAGSAR
jgi:glycosyltransferase involved in cell wall biosynthesis